MKRIKQEKAVDQENRQLALQMPEVIGQQLHEMVVSAGLAVLYAMLEADRESVCGPRYEHLEERRAHRAGHAPGELALGGRRVSVRRPRARTLDGKEVSLKTWEAFAGDDPLNRRALEQMVIGVSTRKYARSLEPVEVKTRGTSKSAVSRRFVALTKQKLDVMLEAGIDELNLVVLMIDGIHIDDHVVLVALGIDHDGNKHILGLHEGATENATACKGLLANLRRRGLRTDRSILVAIDGSKALHKGVTDVFGDKAVIQRCQLHKRRNVVEYLPDGMRTRIDMAMAQAYRCGDPQKAKQLLTNLAKVLEDEHPSAAGSLREGLDETLTVLRLGLPPALIRTLSTTNAIENIQGGIRRVCGRVTTWRGGSMILRWVGAALVEHSRGFRRVRGYEGMIKLVAELRALDGENTVARHREAA